MRRPPLLSESNAHRLRHVPLLVDTLGYVVQPLVSGIRRARREREEGETRQEFMRRVARNTALPTLLGVALVGGLFALERGTQLANRPLGRSSWLHRFDLVQLGAGAVQGMALGLVEGFKPEALGLSREPGSRGRRAMRAAMRQARSNLLGDTAQLAVFKSLGLGWPGE